jgi:hypothetical protein
VPRVLVVGRKAGRVRALADLAVDDFLQRVDALGRVLRVGDKHKMHAITISRVTCAVIKEDTNATVLAGLRKRGVGELLDVGEVFSGCREKLEESFAADFSADHRAPLSLSKCLGMIKAPHHPQPQPHDIIPHQTTNFLSAGYTSRNHKHAAPTFSDYHLERLVHILVLPIRLLRPNVRQPAAAPTPRAAKRTQR